MIPEDLRMTVIRLFKELKIVGLIELRGGVMVEPIQTPYLMKRKRLYYCPKYMCWRGMSTVDFKDTYFLSERISVLSSPLFHYQDNMNKKNRNS